MEVPEVKPGLFQPRHGLLLLQALQAVIYLLHHSAAVESALNRETLRSSSLENFFFDFVSLLFSSAAKDSLLRRLRPPISSTS